MESKNTFLLYSMLLNVLLLINIHCDMNPFFSVYILPITIALIMFGMGMSVDRIDFIRIIKQPQIVVTGLSVHMIILPLCAFILALLLPVHPAFKVGLVLIAACPDGTTANIVNYWIKGNVALCLTLTALNSILILITLPLIVNFALFLFYGQSQTIVYLPVWNTITNVSLVILIPVCIGILVKKIIPVIANKIEKTLEIILTFMLLFVYLMVIMIERQRSSTNLSGYLTIFWLTLSLNIMALFASYFFSRWILKNNRDSYTIAIQVGLQNSALAIYVATSLLKNPAIAVVAVIYGSFSFFTTLTFGYFANKFGNK